MSTKNIKNKSYWKGAQNPVNQQEAKPWSADEFPYRQSLKDLDRRSFLKLLGGSVALAGVASGCRFLPQTKIVPFVKAPEDNVPGKARYFASAAGRGGFSMGILVESHDGRPTKIEGNPQHPASLGGCDPITMAETLCLYDPDRLKQPAKKGNPSTWSAFLEEARKVMAEAGDGSIAILTETVGSQVLADQLNEFLREHPNASWHQYEPVNRDNLREGAIAAFGLDVHSRYDFTKAKVILSVDSDFMQFSEAPVRYAHDVMAGRRVTEEGGDMNRIYAVEATPSLCGAVADHRLPIKPSQVLGFLRALANRLGVPGAGSVNLPTSVDDRWMSALVNDLRANRGASALVAGAHHGPKVHALVHAIHEHLGCFGETVILSAPVLPKPVNQSRELGDLRDRIERGGVKMLLILGGNPVYTAPTDVNFAELLKKVPLTAHVSMHDDETGFHCTWQLPQSHFLEAWGDAVAYDGTRSIVQPLIEPLYDSKSLSEVMDHMLGKARAGEQIVEDFYASATGGDDKVWRTWLAQGWIEAPSAPATAGQPEEGAAPTGMASAPAGTPIQAAVVTDLAASITPDAESSGLELMILPDPTVYDGRYANNNWLQELPKPITNMTWDNAFYLSAATAERLNLRRKEVIGTREIELKPAGLGRPVGELTVDDLKMRAPAAENLGMADDVVVVHMGYGRTRAGQIGTTAGVNHGGGFDANVLRTLDRPWMASGVTLAKTPDFYAMANTQFHNAVESSAIDSGRHIIQEATLAQLIAGETLAHRFGAHGGDHDEDGHTVDDHADEVSDAHVEGSGHVVPVETNPPTMYNPDEHDHSETNYQWAMTIDLNLCTGCNACVTACQAENNIPTVGKEEVQNGREMHWIRIDRYYVGDGNSLDTSNPPIRFQPLTCMQCENAPCEPVCPVAATVHSKEGINQMVYNRCVGTRYCSNNCPYKVRRYNFLHWTKNVYDMPVLRMLQNPDVTVRTRGVMEKCTYCVQRINEARIDAKKDGREIHDGEIVTACQQACPTKAIIFGDKRHQENAVAKSRSSRRNYVLLEEVNTVPRTTYLMRISNPNPELATEVEAGH